MIRLLTLLLLCHWGGINSTYRIGKHVMQKERKKNHSTNVK